MKRNRPRIAFFTPLPTPYRQPLLERLAALPDLDVRVFFLAGTEADRSWTVPVSGERMSFLPVRSLRWGRGKPLFFHFNPGVRTLLDRERFDLLVVPGWAQPTSIVALRWAAKNHVPTVVCSETHRLGVPPRASDRARRVVVRRLVSGVAGGLAAGSAARDYLAGLGVPRERIWFFPNTPDAERIVRETDRLRAGRREFLARWDLRCETTALFVGRLIPAKAPFDLLDAYEKVVRGGLDTGLLIVGDGEMEGALRERIAERKLDKARILGFREGEELLAAYAAADLFVLPSVQEPWGAVVNEAAAAGLPLLLSDVVGAGVDLVEEGRTGFRVPARDVAALADRWRTLLTSEDRARMGRRAREAALARGYDFAVAQFRECVATLLETRP